MTVALRRIAVPRFHRKVMSGQVVDILAEVVSTGEVEMLLDPTSVPTVSLYDSNGVAVVTEGVMSKVSTGLYKRSYQTSVADVVGVYTGSFSVTNNTYTAHLERVSLFKITELSIFTVVHYLTIRDQTGVPWYWYLDSDGSLNPSAFIPVLPTRNVTALLPTTAYWIELINGASLTRYLYPSVDGTPTVTASVPSIGTGIIGSPTFTSINGQSYTIVLDIADDILTVGI